VIESFLVSDAVIADEDLCIWPGCRRARAPGRTAGSGRQKEYCLQANPPEQGGGPVHNARNRWAALRNGGRARHDGRDVAVPGDRDGGGPGRPAAGGTGPSAGQAGESTRYGGESAASVPEQSPVSSAKKRASELLELARRQHAAALAGLRAERELYERVGEELAVLADPAALDLEIATVAARAGRQLAQAEQDAADARRGQLTAERERDEAVRLRAAADDAAEQLTEDAAEAERLLAERTEGFEHDLADLVGRARAAEEAEHAARDEATAVRAAAEASAAAARDRAEQATAALAEALRSAKQAGERADQARERAGEEISRTRDQAAAAVAAAEERARQQAAAAQARADDLAERARSDAERERAGAAQAREEAARAAAEASAAREAARAARSDAVTASARAAALEDDVARLRGELGRRDAAHAAELARLSAAHQAALDAERALLDAERARARRAEDELAAARTK
jgi:hypothetical protein